MAVLRGDKDIGVVLGQRRALSCVIILDRNRTRFQRTTLAGGEDHLDEVGIQLLRRYAGPLSDMQELPLDLTWVDLTCIEPFADALCYKSRDS